MKASVATPMRASIGCDEGRFISPEECALAPLGLSALRSAEGLFSRRGGGGTTFSDNTPSAALPVGSSVVQSTALPSLGTAWHLANPLEASLRPLI